MPKTFPVDRAAAPKWITLATLDVSTMKEAKKIAKEHKDEQNPIAEWKCNVSGPGDGKRHAVFVCNAHEDCTCFVRVVIKGGEYLLQKKGEHTEEQKLRRRKNSTLSYVEEEVLADHMDAGTRPAKIHTQMTKKRARALMAQGLDPLSEEHKRPEGGLKGECPCIIHTPQVQDDTCITLVLCMYYLCIIYVLSTCLTRKMIHVSRSYYACIMHILCVYYLPVSHAR